MKILVTGAAGFIGSYVCKYLLSRGDEVVGLDNINSYYDINLKYGRLLTLGLEENAVNLSGISISNEPIRYYPNGALASHVLGYVGKIPSQQLDNYLNNKEKSYKSDDIVGLTGIESTLEDNLKGIDGYKMVNVNATGKITDELEVKEPVSGDTVYLTLDMDLQKVAEQGLEKTLLVANNC